MKVKRAYSPSFPYHKLSLKPDPAVGSSAMRTGGTSHDFTS